MEKIRRVNKIVFSVTDILSHLVITLSLIRPILKPIMPYTTNIKYFYFLKYFIYQFYIYTPQLYNDDDSIY